MHCAEKFILCPKGLGCSTQLHHNSSIMDSTTGDHNQVSCVFEAMRKGNLVLPQAAWIIRRLHVAQLPCRMTLTTTGQDIYRKSHSKIPRGFLTPGCDLYRVPGWPREKLTIDIWLLAPFGPNPALEAQKLWIIEASVGTGSVWNPGDTFGPGVALLGFLASGEALSEVDFST